MVWAELVSGFFFFLQLYLNIVLIFERIIYGPWFYRLGWVKWVDATWIRTMWVGSGWPTLGAGWSSLTCLKNRSDVYWTSIYQHPLSAYPVSTQYEPLVPPPHATGLWLQFSCNWKIIILLGSYWKNLPIVDSKMQVSMERNSNSRPTLKN